MKAGQFTNFKRGLLSPDAQTRNAFLHLGYAFLALTDRQAENLRKALLQSGLYDVEQDGTVKLGNGFICLHPLYEVGEHE